MSFRRRNVRRPRIGEHLFSDPQGWHYWSSSGKKFTAEEIAAAGVRLKFIGKSKTTGRTTYLVV